MAMTYKHITRKTAMVDRGRQEVHIKSDYYNDSYTM